MAVSTSSSLDSAALRADFPFLEEQVDGKPLAYLDSASSTQKPRQVLDRMRSFYEHEYANVHRGVYRLAERATDGYEAARRTVAAFINAPSEREVIFTRSSTEAINLVAYAWGLQNLGPGDTVVITELEHHANFVPWQFIASKTGASFRHIPIDDAGELQLDALGGLAREGSLFWVVRPEVGFGTVRGLSTVLTGAYIQAIPGRGKDRRKFTGLESASPTLGQPGLNLILSARQLGSVRVGSPVVYRGIEVGSVTGADLGPDATSARLKVFIEQRYAREIKPLLLKYCGDCHFRFPCGSCEWGGTYLDTLQEMLRQG